MKRMWYFYYLKETLLIIITYEAYKKSSTIFEITQKGGKCNVKYFYHYLITNNFKRSSASLFSSKIIYEIIT